MTPTFGTAVLEKYRTKNIMNSPATCERSFLETAASRRQRLEGEDINLHLFAVRVLEDEVRYEVKLSGAAEHKTVKPAEWLSLLHDKLARIVCQVLEKPRNQKSRFGLE